MASAFLGTRADQFVRLTHTRLQAAMSLVAGLILGVALYHLIPHGILQIGGQHAVETAIWWTAVGMVLMVLLLRVLSFHHHDLAPVDGHHHGPSQPSAGDGPSRSWVGVCTGMAMHTVSEGAALGASLRGSLHPDALDGLSASIGIFLAIALHKPLDVFSMHGMMRNSGIRNQRATGVSMGVALLCPLSAVAAYWGASLLGPAEGEAVGRALAFGAGALLCISLSDLLPEIHFHGHDRLLLATTFLAGVALAYALHWAEELPGLY